MRRSKFCPKCGKDTAELHSGLCSECFLGKMGMSDRMPRRFSVGTCKMCGRIFASEGDGYDSTEGAIEHVLRKTLKQREIEKADYRIEGSVVHVTVDLKMDGLEKEVTVDVPLVEKQIVCNMCSLQKASYFNVTIQVRVPKDMLERVVGEIKDEILRMNKKDRYSFVSGTQELKEGTDLMIGSKGAANKVARMIQERYGAEIKKSRKLYGLIEGKKSYRDTILVSVKK